MLVNAPGKGSGAIKVADAPEVIFTKKFIFFSVFFLIFLVDGFPAGAASVVGGNADAIGVRTAKPVFGVYGQLFG